MRRLQTYDPIKDEWNGYLLPQHIVCLRLYEGGGGWRIMADTRGGSAYNVSEWFHSREKANDMLEFLLDGLDEA